MPFVAIRKARKLARVDEVQGDYGVAARYVKEYAAAWRSTIRGVENEIDEKAMGRALDNQDIQAAIDTIPLYDENEEQSRTLWGKLTADIRGVLSDVVEQSGQEAYDRLGLPMKFKIQKATAPEVLIARALSRALEYAIGHSHELASEIVLALRIALQIAKAYSVKNIPEITLALELAIEYVKSNDPEIKRKLAAAIRRASERTIELIDELEGKKPWVPTVPINPYSIKWVGESAGRLIANINAKTEQSVRKLILDGFTRGERAEVLIPQIKQQVGLFPKWAQAVRNREASLIESGVPAPRARKLAEKYRQSLLRKRAMMIARTETIEAQAVGRRQAWQSATEAGQLPLESKRQWMARPESSNPDRPCEICLGLHGQKTGLNEPYHSDIIGDVMGPAAHPLCSCTENIVLPGETLPKDYSDRIIRRRADRRRRLAALKQKPKAKK